MVKQNVPNVKQCATSCASLWREGQNWLSGKAGRNVFSFRELHRNAVGGKASGAGGKRRKGGRKLWECRTASKKTEAIC